MSNAYRLELKSISYVHEANVNIDMTFSGPDIACDIDLFIESNIDATNITFLKITDDYGCGRGMFTIFGRTIMCAFQVWRV